MMQQYASNQQMFIDSYSKVAFAKLYHLKTPITAAALLTRSKGRGHVHVKYNCQNKGAVMGLADWFNTFCDGIKVQNAATISQRYKAITKRLNTDFWETNSDTAHSLYVGFLRPKHSH